MPDSLFFIFFITLTLLLAWALDPHRAAWKEHQARLRQKRHLRQSVLEWKKSPRRWRFK